MNDILKFVIGTIIILSIMLEIGRELYEKIKEKVGS